MNTRTKLIVAVVGVLVIAAIVVLLFVNEAFPGAGMVVNGCPIKRGTSCPNWNLTNVNLAGGTLSASTLNGTDFSYSNCNTVKFDGANLRGAKFINTALGGAIFDNANVSNVDFTGAVFGTATFKNTIYCNTKMPDGTIKNPQASCP